MLRYLQLTAAAGLSDAFACPCLPSFRCRLRLVLCCVDCRCATADWLYVLLFIFVIEPQRELMAQAVHLNRSGGNEEMNGENTAVLDVQGV